MRKIKLLKVNPTTATPGSVEIAGDFTLVFQGKFYRNDAGLTQPGFTDPSPIGYAAIVATTFDIVENTKYSGRYTVYTPVASSDGASSSFGDNKTTIRVRELIGTLVPGDSAELATDGFVTNISTYLLYTGTEEVVVPPGVSLSKFPIEIMGRNVTGWGESFAQNFFNIARNFAAAGPPTNPLVGQFHYDTDDKQVRVWDGVSWDIVNKTTFGTTFRHTQSSPSNTWTVNHLLGLQAPFIAFTQFFVDRGQGPKLIIPSDVTFVSANQLTVSFSNAEIGYVLVRP